MIDTETRNRYGEAILDLAKLTQHGKLNWSRMPTSPSEYVDYASTFEASFEGKTLQLRVSAPSSSSSISFPSYRAMPSYPDRVSLTVLDSGAVIMQFPSVVEMEALVQAVYAKVGSAEDSIISAIKRAAND